MKPIVLIVILAMAAPMAVLIPLVEAKPVFMEMSPEQYHIPELADGNSTGSSPYMAGWYDSGGSHIGVNQTRIVVRFPDTDPSVIQQDNWLAGGMFVTGFDKLKYQIDYAYYTMVTLHSDGSLYFDVGVYQTYEALFPRYPNGTTPWKILLYASSYRISGASPSNSFILTTRFDAPSGMVYWSCEVSSTVFTKSFNITQSIYASTIQPKFIVGIYDMPLEVRLAAPWADPYWSVYYFQFGIMSKYNIGHGGWNVKLEYPQYYKDGNWGNVGKAKSIGGANAFLDARWMWGGENYDGANAYYYENDASLGRYKIIFYYAGSTLGDHTLLWEPPKVTLVIPTGNVNGTRDIAEAIKEELAKIKVNIIIEERSASDITNTVWGDYWDKTWEEAPGQGWDMVWYEFNGVPEDLVNYYLANATPPNGFNIMSWDNSKADRLLVRAVGGASKGFDANEIKAALDKWQVKFMTDPPGIVFYYVSDPQYMGLMVFNLRHPILSNRYVRQAIAHAINYDKIISPILTDKSIEAFKGKAPVHLDWNYTEPDDPSDPELNGDTVPLFNQNLTRYDFNITKAQLFLDLWYYSQPGTDYTKGPIGDHDFSGFVELADFVRWVDKIGTSPSTYVMGVDYLPGHDVDPDNDNNDYVELSDFTMWVDRLGDSYPFEGASPFPPSPVEYPAIYVEPAAIEDTAYEPGTNFTVSIWTNYTDSDIWGYEFTLYYNPLVLHVGINTTDIFAGDGGTPIFPVSTPKIVPDSEKVYVDDVLKTKDTDYIILGDAAIFFTVPPASGTEVKVIYMGDGITNGDLITTSKDSSAKFVPGTIDNTKGSISLTVGYFYYDALPAFVTSGPGILTNVTFTVVGYGDSGILFGDKTKLIGFTEGGWGTEYNIIDASIMPEHIRNGYFRNVEPPPTHDIAITSVTTNPTMVRVGEPANVTAVVENQGTVAEIFDVEVYYDYDPDYPGAKVIGTKTVHGLAASANTSLTFTWNTMGVQAGNHTITAIASTVFGENDTADNTYTDGVVEVYWVHDVAVTGASYTLPYGANATYPGWMINVSATVKNEGDYTENFNVTAYANSTIIDTKSVIDLAPSETTPLTFVWTVPNLTVWTPYPPHYVISAEAQEVPGENDTSDNIFVDGSLTVKHLGDVDGDGDVDNSDQQLLMDAFNSQYGDPEYDWRCDFDGDGDVDNDDKAILIDNRGWQA